MKDINKVIKFLDKKIKREQSIIDDLEDGMIEKAEDYIDLNMFTEIKERLIELEHLNLDKDIVLERLESEQQPPLDDELVEDYTKRIFDWSCDDLENYEHDEERMLEALRNIICSLLQSSYPEKPTVKREDIMSVVIFIAEEFPPKEEDMDMLEGLFIDSGFKVIDE